MKEKNDPSLMTDRFFSEKYGIILYCSLSYLFSFGAIFSSNSHVRAPDTAMIPATAMIPTILLPPVYNFLIYLLAASAC